MVAMAELMALEMEPTIEAAVIEPREGVLVNVAFRDRFGFDDWRRYLMFSICEIFSAQPHHGRRLNAEVGGSWVSVDGPPLEA
jgi:hypothetical protein